MLNPSCYHVGYVKYTPELTNFVLAEGIILLCKGKILGLGDGSWLIDPLESPEITINWINGKR